jgi:hypothetical protein
MSTKKSLLCTGLAVVFLVGAIMACCPTPEGKAVTIAINSPGSGAKAVVGEEVSIDSTATAAAGVDRVDLSVNGTLASRDVPPSGNPTTFRVVQSWTPTADGPAAISVVAFDVNGASSNSATITLQVGDSSGVVPTAVPTDGPGTVVPPGPTDTPLPTVKTDAGCTLDSQYVTDVTIPDGTVMGPGQAFVKTWRVRNSGTCDWGAGYTLVFVSGAQMGGPASVPLPAVAAGGEAEVSVNQTAPGAYGTHKGTWRMRADDGTTFGVNLSVLIVVPAPVTDTPEPPTPTDTPEPTATDTPTPTETEEPASEEVTLLPSSVGSVVDQIGPGSGCYVGDAALELGEQCFITFDLSAIPDSATIGEAGLYYPSATETGNPFRDLGDVQVYHHDYGTLDKGDYTSSADSAKRIHTALRSMDYFGHLVKLNQRGFETLQNSLASDRFQIRLQFDQEADGDGKVDVLSLAGIQLRISYLP